MGTSAPVDPVDPVEPFELLLPVARDVSALLFEFVLLSSTTPASWEPGAGGLAAAAIFAPSMLQAVSVPSRVRTVRVELACGGEVVRRRLIVKRALSFHSTMAPA